MVLQSVHPTTSLLSLTSPAFQAENVRLAGYAEARDFYAGVQWIGPRRRREQRMTLNYARLMIRKAASYTFPLPVTFDVPASEEGDTGTAAAAAAEQELMRVLGEIGADDLDFQLCVEASVSGDAAVKITWDAEASLPIVTAVDAAQLIVTRRPDRPKVPLRIEHHYTMTPDEFAAAMPTAVPHLQALTGSHGALEVVEYWDTARWRVTYAGQVVEDTVNPYGWLPYLVLANNVAATRFWGESDLVDLYDVCRELNSRVSVASDVLTLAGWPIAVLENVEGSEGIQVGPGAKWELPEGAKAYLLDLLEHGGIDPHTNFITEIRRSMHDLGESPKTSFGDSGRDLSGAALEVEIQPLVQKVRRKRRMFDGYYAARNTRLLDLMERFGGVTAISGVRRAVAVWPDILPSDADGESIRLATMTGSDNLSHRAAMAIFGVEDPEGEWERLLEEKTAITATEPEPAFPGEKREIGGDDAKKTTPA